MMFIQKFKAPGIAQLSYMVGSENKAILIDPVRDVQQYLNFAKEKEVTIKYVLETHRNEDFIIGSIPIADKTDAEIYHGLGELNFTYGNPIQDGEELHVGAVGIKALHTPGHTNNSMSYVLQVNKKSLAVFTGDVLFVNEVGRTDFYPDHMERQAEYLYDSIHDVLLPLGDDVILYPAHGAGSVCGAGISDREISTLGFEKKYNPRLQLSKEDFIQFKVNEKHSMPPYFKKMEENNLHGPEKTPIPIPTPFNAEEFSEAKDEATIVDTRMPESFASAFIEGSYNIWLDGLSPYAGWLLDYGDDFLLVLDNPCELDLAIKHLYRIGFDNIVGYLKGGFAEWYVTGKPTEKMDTLTIEEIEKKLQDSAFNLVDVRHDYEYEEQHIPGAKNIDLDIINTTDSFSLGKDSEIATSCGVGVRASTGASILHKKGYKNVAVFLGSLKAWMARKDELAHENK